MNPFAHGGLAELGADLAINSIKYSGGGYTYFCETAPGVDCARGAAIWRVLRITDVTGDAIWAGTGRFEHAATDLATVAALAYALGA